MIENEEQDPRLEVRKNLISYNSCLNSEDRINHKI